MSIFVSLFVEDSSANTSNRYNRPCDDASPQTASAICVKDPVSAVTNIIAKGWGAIVKLEQNQEVLVRFGYNLGQLFRDSP